MERGGGERGSIDRSKSNGFANSMRDVVAVTVAAITGGGSTKVIDATNERSESWQQDMAQSFAKTLGGGSSASGEGVPPEHPMLRPILELTEQLKRADAPNRIVRDAKGKPVGIEAVQ